MSDIAKCNDNLCPSKDYCYRFTATNGMRQYFQEFNREEDADNCNFFYPNGKNSIRCKHNGVKSDGEICNLNYCTYPKCVQESYCKYCGQTDGVHKMGCETKKIQITL